MNTIIYFIYDSQRNAVKIGITNDVERRLYGLQTGNPVKLELKHSLRGTHRDERLLHKHYEKYNILREWFEYSNEIMLDIEQNNVENIINTYRSYKKEKIKQPLIKRVKKEKTLPAPKPPKEKKTPVVKIKKQTVRKTQEELKESKKNCTKRYKQRKVVEKIEKTYKELDKHFIKRINSYISTKEMGEYLLAHNLKSKYGEQNLPVKHVAEYFDVQMKKVMINKKRQMYVVGLDYAQKGA